MYIGTVSSRNMYLCQELIYMPMQHITTTDSPNEQVFYLLLLFIVGIYISAYENAKIF